MERIVIFGNSGSGKSTLAKKLSDEKGLSHLDLDLLAWLPTDPPQRKPIKESADEIQQFIKANKNWVIEGCYSDLLEMVTADANELIYMDLPAERCIENARNRPWEPHKYASKEAQDANLQMLIDWISQYPTREDTFSKRAHQHLYDSFSGKITRITDNE